MVATVNYDYSPNPTSNYFNTWDQFEEPGFTYSTTDYTTETTAGSGYTTTDKGFIWTTTSDGTTFPSGPVKPFSAAEYWEKKAEETKQTGYNYFGIEEKDEAEKKTEPEKKPKKKYKPRNRFELLDFS